MTDLETTAWQRYRDDKLADPDARERYEQARAEIEQIDKIMEMLDELRIDLGISKAELARRIGKKPESVRRLFSAQVRNPELRTVSQIAAALDAEVVIKRKPKVRRPTAQSA